MLSHRLFSAVEQVSLVLQKKNIAIQDALAAVETAKNFFKHIRSEEEFNRFYEECIQFSEKEGIGQPVLPRSRKQPARYDSGSEPYQFNSVKVYYRKFYFKACDRLSGELQNRFETIQIPSVVSMELAVMKAANKKDFKNEVTKIGESCFKNDVDLEELKVQLALLPDVIKKGTPEVKTVTSIHTVCEAMNSNELFKEMLPAVHKLL